MLQLNHISMSSPGATWLLPKLTSWDTFRENIYRMGFYINGFLHMNLILTKPLVTSAIQSMQVYSVHLNPNSEVIKR
jgi:hypothetical protein